MFIKLILKFDFILQLSALISLFVIGSYATLTGDNWGWVIYLFLITPILSWQLFSSILHLILAVWNGSRFSRIVAWLRYIHLTVVVLGIFFFILLYYVFMSNQLTPLIILVFLAFYTFITGLDLFTRRTNILIVESHNNKL